MSFAQLDRIEIESKERPGTPLCPRAVRFLHTLDRRQTLLNTRVWASDVLNKLAYLIGREFSPGIKA
jgi:hypothetical protein